MEDFINQRKLQQLAKLSSSRQVTVDDVKNANAFVSAEEAIAVHDKIIQKQKLVVKVFKAISSLGNDVGEFGSQVINDYNFRVRLTGVGVEFAKDFPNTVNKVNSLTMDQLLFLEKIFN